MENLHELVVKRGRAKAVITRNNNWYTLNKSKCTRGEIISRQEQIREAFNEFNHLHEQIELLLTDEQEIERQQVEIVKFENEYFFIAGAFEDFLHSLNAGSQNFVASNPSGSNSDLNEEVRSGSLVAESSSVHNVNVKLPQLSLPEFYGAYDKWSSFHDLFKSLIHDNNALANVQKMYYLQSSLKGEAAEIIAGLELTDSNYLTAWDILVERYENKRKRINTHLQNILDLPPVNKESSHSLKNLMDTYQKNIRALDNLEDCASHWNSFLLFLLESKLDFGLNKDWDAKISGNNSVTAEQLIEFLKERFRSIDKKPIRKVDPPKTKTNFSKNVCLATNYSREVSTTCILCKENHLLNQCKAFLKLPPFSRLNEVRRLKACTNCLRKGHSSLNCKSVSCKTCQKRHHTLLHLGEINHSTNKSNSDCSALVSDTTISSDSSKHSQEGHISTHAQNSQEVVFLSTAWVYIFDSNNEPIKCRALLDSGSQSSFITTELSKRLGLPCTEINIPILGISSSSGARVTSKLVAKIKSIRSNYTFTLPFLVLDTITGIVPQFHVDVSNMNIPQNLTLADSQFFEPLEIDLLLGANIFFNLLLPNQIKIGNNGPLLQESKLGWVVSGPLEAITPRRLRVLHCQLQDDTLSKQVESFWSLEELSNNPQTFYSSEENECEQDFVRNFSRDISGRFVVKLPIKDLSCIGSSMEIAVRRFQTLERTFSKDKELKNNYSKFMKEYIDLNHMSVVKNPDHEPFLYYLPHHCVKKESSLTTKLRVVFDASAKPASGSSLNDVLRVGPCIQDDILAILLRFRLHNVAFTADIAKMYRQVLIHPEHQSLQCILWRFDTCDPLLTYKLHTVTYGTGPASFLATRCLKQLAIENELTYPETSMSILNDFYMDDYISGESDESSSLKRITEISHILNSAGFVLRQWVTNKPHLLEKLSFDNSIIDYIVKSDGHSKTLGLQWDPRQDVFYFSPNFNVRRNTAITKRVILSEIARLFDPLGLLGPIVITAKIILQELWQLRSDWDDIVPTNILSVWKEFYLQLEGINDFKIPRHFLLCQFTTVEIHGFCDASMKAYGACLYLKTVNNIGEVMVSLACAKSRVAPLKTVSLPRLELCGALLLSQLFKKVSSALKGVQFCNCYFWTDSTIVLSWLKAEPNRLKIFVANRVTKILEITKSSAITWYHVPTKLNPADLISRGVKPNQLKDKDLWWHGPEFLRYDQSSWPSSSFSNPDVIPELKEIQSVSLTTLVDDGLIERYSSYNKLIHVVAYSFRFVQNCLAKGSGHKKLVNSLQCEELQHAKHALIKIVQLKYFKDEIYNLRKNKCVSNISKLKCLNPFLDELGIIRVGGRLSNSGLSSESRYPVVLPSKGNFTKLVILKVHLQNLHAGPQLVLSRVRMEFWPLSGRRTVRAILTKCIVCFKCKPLELVQKMGDLPADRVNVARVFSKVGIDYAGPYLIKEVKYRNKKFVKAYVCIFICLVTKAIHIELVSDLTVDGFLNILKRFIARRGLCSDIYSDNAGNFAGANRELQNFVLLTEGAKCQNFLTESSIKWHFIPPRSPHFGGLWESAVRSVKSHLKKILHNVHLTYEDLYSLLTQIESIVNSRPLTPLTEDPNDLQPLTPGHFIIGDSLNSFPEPTVSKISNNLKSNYKQLQLLTQHFWKRWSSEYLHHLQVRSKWQSDVSLIKEGALVLIKEDGTPPRKWNLGRIIGLHPGKDNVVRTVSLKTSSGILKRAVTRTCLLPIDC